MALEVWALRKTDDCTDPAHPEKLLLCWQPGAVMSLALTSCGSVAGAVTLCQIALGALPHALPIYLSRTLWLRCQTKSGTGD